MKFGENHFDDYIANSHANCIIFDIEEYAITLVTIGAGLSGQNVESYTDSSTIEEFGRLWQKVNDNGILLAEELLVSCLKNLEIIKRHISDKHPKYCHLSEQTIVIVTSMVKFQINFVYQIVFTYDFFEDKQDVNKAWQDYRNAKRVMKSIKSMETPMSAIKLLNETETKINKIRDRFIENL